MRKRENYSVCVFFGFSKEVQFWSSIFCSANSSVFGDKSIFQSDSGSKLWLLVTVNQNKSESSLSYISEQNAILDGCSTVSRGERIVFWWPNTNTNIIRLPQNDRIRIRILFGFPKITEYEYEYYSASQKWPNTNTNIIRFPKNYRIRILFGFPKRTEYEYYSVFQKWPNTNIIRIPKNT